MSIFRDRTEDFKDYVRKAAVSNGYNESKLALTLASFSMHKPKERSPITTVAFKTLENIKQLDQFMMKHRKDYVDMHRNTELTEKWRGSGLSPFLRVSFQ